MCHPCSPPAGRRDPLRPGRLPGWGRLSLVLVMVLTVLARAAPNGGSAPKEPAVKAAFLYNFTKFIDWPAAAFDRPDAPFIIAMLGPTPIAAELGQAVRGRKVGGREVIIRHCRTATEAAVAQMVFVVADDATMRELLQRVDGRPVILVGESERFLRQGGTIAFLFEADNKVRFAINMTAADRAGLRISAQLQKLAKSILRGN